MKPKKKMKKLRITEADFMLANRRAARLEEIAEHGRPVSYRTALHKSKKVYDRKRLKKAGIGSDDLLFSLKPSLLCRGKGFKDSCVILAQLLFLEGIVLGVGNDDVVKQHQVHGSAGILKGFCGICICNTWFRVIGRMVVGDNYAVCAK